MSLFFCLKTVKEDERAVICRLGRVKTGGVVGPGILFIIPCMDSVTVVDLRAVSFDVSAQEILTRASVTVSVDAVIYFNMENAMATVCKVVQYVDTVALLLGTLKAPTPSTQQAFPIVQNSLTKTFHAKISYI